VAAGLYPHELRYVNVYLPISVGLFLAGVALCEFVVIPKAVKYLLAFNEWMGLQSDLRLSEWMSFAILMPLVFGLAFQTPLVMLFLERLGILSQDLYRKHRRIAIFAMAVVAAIIAPSPDIFSIMSLTVPLWCLYELGILMCRFAPRHDLDVEVPKPEEMVEV
jgi:sec-independent protein translocase protein TatC